MEKLALNLHILNVDLDSPTVSATQIVPPWPRPRDKSNEAPDPDPDPEPEAPPPPPPPGEGAGEEAGEEEEEEDIDEETENRRAAEKARLAEERRRAQELPPPLPPPPSPQPEPELAPPPRICEEEIETLEPIEVDRQVLLTEDAKKRYKIRQLRKKAAPPLIEILQPTKTASDELLEPSNFNTLPDSSQIVSGTDFIANEEAQHVMPFVSIMAIVTSYKYSINTWTSGIVDFVVQAGRELYDNKRAKFQFAPMHVIPRIRIGRQTYEAVIDVVAEGPTWKLEEVLNRQFCCRFDRLMMTTCNYSAAIFLRNGLYYMYDASPCNPMGLREDSDVGGACFLRFRTLHDLVTRMLFNKDGKREDQQFVMSRILVRQLSKEPRMQLPDDYEYATGRPRCPNSKTTIAAKPKKKVTVTDPNIGSMVDKKVPIGYQQSQCGTYVIEGTTSLGPRSNSDYIQDCHFVSLVAMLLATMHPVKTWDQIMIDVCLEKGLEIADKATNLNICEKRALRNVIIDGKYINLNIKRIEVINENPERTLDQYLNAVMQRLRYVMIRFPECCLVVCHSDEYYHLFDPYESPIESEFYCGSSYCPSRESVASNGSSKKGDKRPPRTLFNATWSLCPTLDNVLYRIRTVVSPETVEEPEFYNFELTSVKALPKYSALNCKLSPMFKADVNPNAPYLRPKKRCPRIDEKLYWLCSDGVPWSRMNTENSIGCPRRSPPAVWNDWDIEVPGDLYSVWGSLHPNHDKYDESHRGTQYLATCVVALAFTKVCRLSAWTGRLIDGIVDAGDHYHQRCLECVGEEPNTELTLEVLPKTFELYPYSFKVKFEQIIFGFMYNKLQDRYNLSAALEYFFEAHDTGILVSPSKNLGFGKIAASYFMFDCQSYGVPLFSPDQGVAYMLKCESLNRLIYCMTMTLNVRKHGQVFHLYRVNIRVQSKKDNENQQ
ncbi:unnamed protein product [Plutella xylostella]|uniref:(diamondback moth) hypothetical protein n=1 Tax=Plutella xylostella TaxID=51655 RepID=A0A8S4EZ97_PLUXY|nr:unnamed protein product [Plutella xylostella]